MDVFFKLWDSAWSVKLEHILRHTILTLRDQPKATIADIIEILLKNDFRKEALRYCKSESVNKFWKREFPEYMNYDLLPVMNKIRGMMVHPAIRHVLIENTEEVTLHKAMDQKKIVLVNLSKGYVGADVSHILGALFITSIVSTAFSRVDNPEKTIFHLWIIWMNFTTSLHYHWSICFRN